MAYLTYHYSAPLRCSVCLISFLLRSFSLSVLLLFKLCVPYPFSAQILFCLIQLLHSDSSSHMNHHSNATANSHSSNNLISSLYHVFIASVHLVHAIFSIPLYDSTTLIFFASRVLWEINIVTLHLLWLKPSVVSGSFTVACNSSRAINT
jgi:hypothetical protein